MLLAVVFFAVFAVAAFTGVLALAEAGPVVFLAVTAFGAVFAVAAFFGAAFGAVAALAVAFFALDLAAAVFAVEAPVGVLEGPP